MPIAKATNKRKPIFICNITSFTANVSICSPLLPLFSCANKVGLMVFWKKENLSLIF